MKLTLIFNIGFRTVPPMLVCHCNGVSDRKIRKAVRKGAGSIREVAQMSGAGACCGGCRPAVRDILEDELTAREQRQLLTVVPVASVR